MATQTATETKTHNEYTVGWVCALPKEQTATTAMLDQIHVNLPKPSNDPNAYTLGSIGKHNVVIACLPIGHIGNNPAATVAAQMVSTFPSIKFGLMVGIGGGIPPKVRLGDVVVSAPVGSFPGVVQWDFGKAKDGGFERTGSLNNPPSSLLTAITKLETKREMVGYKIPEYLDELKRKWPRLAPRYLKSDSLKDILFRADCSHVCQSTANHGVTSNDDYESEEGESCRFCDKTKVIKRKSRDMRVHYGLIASGNQVIKSATHRDKLNKDLGGHLLCIEMEAAGLMNNFPCVIIRGICDYADSHKNKEWQEYAAAVAAAFAKDLLDCVQPSDVDGECTVKDMLGDVLTNVSTTRVDVSHIKSYLDDDKNLQVFEWITSVDYGSQHSDFLKRRQPGTGQWLLDSTEYQTWLESTEQTLFCPGIPGVGKTILTSIVIDHLEGTFTTDLTVGIAYIYCNYRRQEEQVIDILFASLLKQLSRGRTSLPDCVKGIYDTHKDKRTRPSLNEILMALHSLAAIYSRIFIIVDALDECQHSDGCRQEFLTQLFSLQGKCGANLFMTSRFIPEIVDRFKTASVSLEIRANTKDIERYLEGHIEQLPRCVQQDPKLRQKITTEISGAVDGMFLLAQIYLDSLNDKVTPKAINKALNDLQKPISGLGETNKVEVLAHAYEQAMLRINGQQPGFKDLANKVLSWIIFAERRLTKTELQHALAVEVDELELDEENMPLIQDMVSVCAGLVTVDDESNIVRLVHYTTQEYFNQTRKRWFPDADIIMTDTCAAYLLFRTFEGGPCLTEGSFKKRLELNPLYNYAAQNWGHHARKASSLCHKAMGFLECKAKMDASIEVLKNPNYGSPHWYIYKRPTIKMTSLHLAAYFGIEETFGVLVEKTTDVNTKDEDGLTPLSLAAFKGHEAIVKLLLVIPSADVNSRDEYLGETPLSKAAKRGCEAIVKLLLAARADLNPRDNNGQTPLWVAAYNGHEAVIKLLLTARADLNSRDYNNRTPLSVVIEEGDEDILQLLLAAGADLNSRDSDSDTPLLTATILGKEAIVQLLLAAGADLNSRNYNDQTPLSIATEDGDKAIVQLLLAAGADLNSRNYNDQTPLAVAIEMGHEAVVKLLLEKHAETESRDEDSEMVLLPHADVSAMTLSKKRKYEE